MVVVGVEFTETINLGAVILIIFGVGLGLFWTVRSNVAKYWREVAEAEQRRVVQMQETLQGMVGKELLEAAVAESEEQRRLKHEAISDAAALRLTRDLTPLIKAQQSLMERMLAVEETAEARYGNAMHEMREQFAKHEERAQARHEALLEATIMIVERLAK